MLSFWISVRIVLSTAFRNKYCDNSIKLNRYVILSTVAQSSSLDLESYIVSR